MSNETDFTSFSDKDWTAHVSAVKGSVQGIHVPQDDSNDSTEKVGDAAVADQIAQYIDHTQLKTDATLAQIDQLCDEAKEYDFKTVCVRLEHVSHCRAALKDTHVGIACVIGFYEGTQPTASKIAEAQAALQAGASELDVVLNYPLLLSSSPQYVGIYYELSELKKEAGSKAITKLIIETSQLDKHQIVAACTLAHAAEFDFVKTSTGFKGHGATVEHVRLMKRVVEYLDQTEGKGRKTQVKASGGVRTSADALAMVRAGATRIGASSGVAIVKEVQGMKVGGNGIADGVGGY